MVAKASTLIGLREVAQPAIAFIENMTLRRSTMVFPAKSRSAVICIISNNPITMLCIHKNWVEAGYDRGIFARYLGGHGCRENEKYGEIRLCKTWWTQMRGR
jgi:hypothetical protein